MSALTNSVGNAFLDYMYFNTPGNAVEHLENLNNGGNFTDRPVSDVVERGNSGGNPYPWDYRFTPSNDDTRDVDPSPSGKDVYRSPLQPPTIDYINAEYAKHYGMNRATAYQEALANTAYQRAVADMKAAGLNPAAMFGGGKGSGANVVSGRTASSGGGGGGKSSDNGFSLGDSANLIGSAVELVANILTGSDSISSAAGNAAKSLTQTLDKALKGS